MSPASAPDLQHVCKAMLHFHLMSWVSEVALWMAGQEGGARADRG